MRDRRREFNVKYITQACPVQAAHPSAHPPVRSICSRLPNAFRQKPTRFRSRRRCCSAKAAFGQRRPKVCYDPRGSASIPLNPTRPPSYCSSGTQNHLFRLFGCDV